MNYVDDIQPDLNKAPPHVEGELLKQNVKARFGKKGWHRFFFVVKTDKLQYFRKKEDSQTNKDPLAFVRMSQVTEITEAVFTGVPKKHHLNCGFTVVSYHPLTQEEQTFNLLAETADVMRYWVFALRYIKAYWSKMKVRDTVLSAEQERKLLDRILQAEDNDQEDEVYGDYGNDEQSSDEPSSRQVSVHFASGSKVKVTLSMSQTTSDLLEMSEIKNNLSSSSAFIVRVDEGGKDVILESHDHPALHHSKSSTLYAVEHSQRLLVVYIGGLKEYECLFVSHHATASDIIEEDTIRNRLDVLGMANRGVFLKQKEGEQPFGLAESPCDVLFERTPNGGLRRLPVGQLVVRNKTLGGGRVVSRVTRRMNRSIIRPVKRTYSEEGRMLEEISEEEDLQARALDMLLNKKHGQSELEDTMEVSIDGEVYVLPPDMPGKDSKRSSSGSVHSEPSDEGKVEDDRGFDQPVMIGSRKHTGSMAGMVRPRHHGQSLGERPSPSVSPATSPTHSRSRSPARRLPDLPEKDSRASPGGHRRFVPAEKDSKGSPNSNLKRKGATRTGSLRSGGTSGGSSREAVPAVKVTSDDTKRGVADNSVGVLTSSIGLHKKGPTIILSNEKAVTAETRAEGSTHTTSRQRSPSTRIFDNLQTGNSRSSAFGHPHSPVDSITSFPLPSITTDSLATATGQSAVSSFGSGDNSVLQVDDEARLENLFSRSFQQEQEERSVQVTKQVDTLSAKVKAVSKEPTKSPGKSPEVSPTHQTITPMLINFEALQQKQEAPPTSSADSAPSKPTAAIKVTSPSFLKVILLQASEATDLSAETKPMDFINLSGVCLRNERGVWVLQEGYNYHDPLPFDCADHTETFPLPGGIRVVYNHTHKRWHVYPPPPTESESVSVADSTEHAQTTEDVDTNKELTAENSLYLSKKMIVTEIGTAFHHIMEQFEVSRDQAEKKKVGSDMINVSMGHIVRGEFCSGIAHLLLDGLKPYRFEGLVQDDIWKVTVSFSNEAQSNPSSPLVYPSFDKLIFQPIGALKTLMRDNNIKFRTFVCLAMSKGLFTGFLEALPKQSNTLKKFYYPNAFLRLASDYPSYQSLYQQILVTLEPMVHLPFDLSIDFESRQAAETTAPVGVGEGVVSGRSSSNASETGSITEQSNSSTPVRPIVVVKTHAATGQRSTAGNVKSVVWDHSPLHASDNGQVTQEDTDSDGRLSSITALKQLQESTNTPFTQSLPVQNQPPPTRRTAQKNTGKKQDPWWKKISDSFKELNMGGAITGPPRNVNQQQTQKPQPPPAPVSNERRVKALYNNIADDGDELTFNKDDILIVKDQINEEWLICTSGNRSGIVPVSYVQPLS